MREHYQDKDLQDLIADEVIHVSRRLLQRGAHVMESLGIGVGQVPILKLLSMHESMTQREIADEIRVTAATICGTLKRMERAELIVRRPAADDGRIICVSLSEKGRSVCKQAIDAFRMPYDEMLVGFSTEECGQLAGFIRRMSSNLTNALKDEETSDDSQH